MVQVTLLGRSFDVAPYKLGALRQAAPYVDAVNAKIGALTSMEAAVDVMSYLVGFVQIGLVKLDPTITPQMLDDEVGYDDIPALQEAFSSILKASGMKSKGEASAPPVAEPAPALSA